MNSRNHIKLGLGFSLALHLLLGLGLVFSPQLDLAPSRPSVVDLIESPPQTLDQTQKLTGQIVQQDKNRINTEKPKDARFVSQNDQTVVKETRAAKTGRFSNSAGSQAKQESQMQKRPTQAPLEEKSLFGEKPAPLHRFAPQISPPVTAETANSGGNGPEVATNDHLKDVAIGVQTLLSTRQFLYYSYYNRIKEKLQQSWEPKIKTKVQKIFTQGRTIASTADKVTKTIITLDNRGTLVKVQVIGPSGVTDLDDAAVEAFKEAAPFPNPPRGIIDQDGYIRIRWDFVLEASQNVLPMIRSGGALARAPGELEN